MTEWPYCVLMQTRWWNMDMVRPAGTEHRDCKAGLCQAASFGSWTHPVESLPLASALRH